MSNTYLVLEDFRGPSVELPAGARFDDPTDYSVVTLRASGLVAILYVPATMSAILLAFLTQREQTPAASLVAALLAGGVAIDPGEVPATRVVNTSAPITGGGPLTADINIGIVAASDSAPGSMSAADHAKLAALPADAQSAAQVSTAINTALTALKSMLSFFAGALAAGTTRYLSDNSTSGNPAPVGFPIDARRLQSVRWNVTINGLTSASSATVMKNGSATAHTIAITAGATGMQVTTVDVDFVPTDTLDLQVIAGAGGTTLQVSALLFWQH